MSETRTPAAERQAAYRQGVARRLDRIEQLLEAVAAAMPNASEQQPERQEKEPKNADASVS